MVAAADPFVPLSWAWLYSLVLDLQRKTKHSPSGQLEHLKRAFFPQRARWDSDRMWWNLRKLTWVIRRQQLRVSLEFFLGKRALTGPAGYLPFLGTKLVLKMRWAGPACPVSPVVGVAAGLAEEQ